MSLKIVTIKKPNVMIKILEDITIVLKQIFNDQFTCEVGFFL